LGGDVVMQCLSPVAFVSKLLVFCSREQFNSPYGYIPIYLPNISNLNTEKSLFLELKRLTSRPRVAIAELAAVTRGYWRKQNSRACAAKFCEVFITRAKNLS
jgi:hypothetical protein